MDRALAGQLTALPPPAAAASPDLASGAPGLATGIALVLLAGVALILLVVAAALIWHRRYDSPHAFRLAVTIKVNELLCRLWYRWRRIGPCTVPRTGAVIITANHTCTADPLFLCAGCTYRKIAFLIAREYANLPVWRFFVRLVECIPVRRDGKDVAATKEALRRLHDGKAMGIFIQGRIAAPGQTVQPKDGVALLALRTGATVIPVHISGTKYRDSILGGFLARHRVRVRFGDPVDLDEFAHRSGREAVSAATQRIAAAIGALAPESHASPDHT